MASKDPNQDQWSNYLQNEYSPVGANGNVQITQSLNQNSQQVMNQIMSDLRNEAQNQNISPDKINTLAPLGQMEMIQRSSNDPNTSAQQQTATSNYSNNRLLGQSTSQQPGNQPLNTPGQLGAKQENPNAQLENSVRVGRQKILCTLFASQGKIPVRVLIADYAQGERYSDTTVDGYYSWAAPLTEFLYYHPKIAHFFEPFVVGWAHVQGELEGVVVEMSYKCRIKHRFLGNITKLIGIPFCFCVGLTRKLLRETVKFQQYLTEKLKKIGK